MNDTDEHHDLDDGREEGEWTSRYPKAAWVQIVLELLYTLTLLIGSVIVLLDGATIHTCPVTEPDCIVSSIFGVSITAEVAKWVALTIAGMIGGSVFVLKWQYHSVQTLNRQSNLQ